MRLLPWILLGVLLVAAPGRVVAAKEPPVVAVLYFDYDGKDGELALLKKGLASMLISDLSGNDAIRVVERDRLEAVLGELELQKSAKIDRGSAVKVGKLLGARYLVLGGYFDVMKTLRIDARVIEVETGKVVLSIGANGKPEDFLVIEQKLAADLNKHFATATPPVATAESRPKRAKPRLPKALAARIAIEYGRALTAIDAADKAAAKASLKQVMVEAPDFQLASIDLDRLMK